jgi:hypothetical protein
MAIRRPVLLAATLLTALLLGAQRAEAETALGSPDPTVTPDGFAYTACPAGTNIGFQQFALRGGDVVAEESGVLVSARVNAKRIAGSAQPRIAVLRPSDGDDIGVTVGPFSPLPVTSRTAAVHEVNDLHLPVEVGDSLGFLFPTGQVDLGVKSRPRPDGAVQRFTEPCNPCQMDGGTGIELLLEGTIEPDEDGDRLGDETQDLDGGGDLFETDDEDFDDWFDELDEEEEPSPTGPRRLRLLQFVRGRHGDPILLLAVPRSGRLSGNVTTSAGSWDLARLPRTIGAGEVRARGPGRTLLRLRLSRKGRRMVRRRGRLRARVVVSLRTRSGIQVTMRRVRL